MPRKQTIRMGPSKSDKEHGLNPEYHDFIKERRDLTTPINKKITELDAPFEQIDIPNATSFFEANGVVPKSIIQLGPFKHLELITELNQDYHVSGDRATWHTNTPYGTKLSNIVNDAYLLLADPQMGGMNCLPTNTTTSPQLITTEKTTNTDLKDTNTLDIVDKSTCILPRPDATRREKFNYYNRTIEDHINGISGTQFPLSIADRTKKQMHISEKQAYNKLVLSMLFLDDIDQNRILIRDAISGKLKYPALEWMDPKEHRNKFHAYASPINPFFDKIRIEEYALAYDGFTEDLNVLRKKLPDWRRIPEDIKKYLHNDCNPDEDTLNNLRNAILDNKLSKIDYKYGHDVPTRRAYGETTWGTIGLPKDIIMELYLNDPNSRPEEDDVAQILDHVHKEYNRIHTYLGDKDNSKQLITYLAKVRDGMSDTKDPFLRELIHSHKLRIYNNLWSGLEKSRGIYYDPIQGTNNDRNEAIETILHAKTHIDDIALENYLNEIEFDNYPHSTAENTIYHMVLDTLEIENGDYMFDPTNLVNAVIESKKIHQ